jgi:hypothetical protein
VGELNLNELYEAEKVTLNQPRHYAEAESGRIGGNRLQCNAGNSLFHSAIPACKVANIR